VYASVNALGVLYASDCGVDECWIWPCEGDVYVFSFTLVGSELRRPQDALRLLEIFLSAANPDKSSAELHVFEARGVLVHQMSSTVWKVEVILWVVSNVWCLAEVVDSPGVVCTRMNEDQSLAMSFPNGRIECHGYSTLKDNHSAMQKWAQAPALWRGTEGPGAYTEAYQSGQGVYYGTDGSPTRPWTGEGPPVPPPPVKPNGNGNGQQDNTSFWLGSAFVAGLAWWLLFRKPTKRKHTAKKRKES